MTDGIHPCHGFRHGTTAIQSWTTHHPRRKQDQYKRIITEFLASTSYLQPKIDASKNDENKNPSRFSGRTIKIRPNIDVPKNAENTNPSGFSGRTTKSLSFWWSVRKIFGILVFRPVLSIGTFHAVETAEKSFPYRRFRTTGNTDFHLRTQVS